MDKSVSCLVLILHVTRLLHSLSITCPSSCLCTNGTTPVSVHVTCAGAGLTVPPHPMPASTSVLDLSGNNIRALEVSTMASLTSLISLKLTSNDLEFIENDVFASMVKLQSLDLSINRLRHVTERTLLGARALQYLDLSHNALVTVDRAFDSVTSLERLDMSNNELTSLGSDVFHNLTNLRYLLISNNHIRIIDKDAFAPLERLMYLVLRGNDLEAPPLQLTFTSLVLSYVDFSECHLRIPPRGLPNSVRYLQLRRNNISSIHRTTFVDTPYVTILVLDENSIDHIDERTFEEMPYLQQLWLNVNRLRSLPTSLPVTLQRLLLDSNAISSLHNIFPIDSQLTTLSLSANNVTTIAPGTFRRLNRLQSLDLSDNNIKILRKNIFASNLDLQTLVLSRNPLRFLPRNSLAGLRSLSSLSLSFIPGPTYLSPGIFDDVINLQRLEVDSSPSVASVLLSTASMHLSLARLTELSMANCDVSTLPAHVADWFTGLSVLTISSSLWYCDRQMLWFRDWLLATHVTVDDKETIACFEPRHLHQRPIISLADSELSIILSTSSTSSTSTETISDYIESYENIDYANYDDGSALNAANSSLMIGATAKYPYVEDVTSLHDNVTVPLFSLAPALDSAHRLGTVLQPPPDPRRINSGNLELGDAPLRKSTSRSSSSSSLSNSVIIAVIVTTLLTVVVALVIVIVIVCLVRKQAAEVEVETSRNPPSTNGVSTFEHRNGGFTGGPGQGQQNGNGLVRFNKQREVLYYTPHSALTSNGGHHVTYQRENVHNDSLADVTGEEGEILPEGITLIPGRDINHEGPLRVYKWEEF